MIRPVCQQLSHLSTCTRLFSCLPPRFPGPQGLGDPAPDVVERSSCVPAYASEYARLADRPVGDERHGRDELTAVVDADFPEALARADRQRDHLRCDDALL